MACATCVPLQSHTAKGNKPKAYFSCLFFPLQGRRGRGRYLIAAVAARLCRREYTPPSSKNVPGGPCVCPDIEIWFCLASHAMTLITFFVGNMMKKLAAHDDFPIFSPLFLKSLGCLLAGGDRGQRRGGQVKPDPALLQGHLYQELQEDHRRGLPREAHHVSQIRDITYEIINCTGVRETKTARLNFTSISAANDNKKERIFSSS